MRERRQWGRERKREKSEGEGEKEREIETDIERGVDVRARDRQINRQTG